MTGCAAATIVAKRTLPYARALAQSFRRHHPDIPFLALLADEVQGCFDPAAEPFELVTADAACVPPGVRFRYLQQALSYAATPLFLAHLLERGFDRVVFFKQESLVTGDHDPVFSLLERYPVVLTPHLLAPVSPERELNILQSGTFNVGMVGVADTPAARQMLSWWGTRTATHCRHAVGEGMHFEQRWLDLAPVYFEGVHLLRDASYNVAHWNLPERASVDARLVRFSGFDPQHEERVTRYNDRLNLDELGPVAALFRRYAVMLRQAGWEQALAWPYAYDRFHNGVRIPDLARELYDGTFSDPFETGPGSFYEWLNEPVDGISRFWRAVFERRDDVRAAYGDNRKALLAWTHSSGAREHGVPPEMLP